MVPDPAIACVGLEYFCFEGDGLWSSSDADLIALATKEMAILGLCDPADVVGGAVVRQEKAYPVYDDDYAAHVAAMREELESRYPTLPMLGRTGMHRYNNHGHVMITAVLTVADNVSCTHPPTTCSGNTDTAYHEHDTDDHTT